MMSTPMSYFKVVGAYQLDKLFIYTLPDFVTFIDDSRRLPSGAKISPDAIICYPGFQWNGSSGPARDHAYTMPATLVHDVLYEYLHVRQLGFIARWQADRVFLKLLGECGMSWPRRMLWWLGVRVFGYAWVLAGET